MLRNCWKFSAIAGALIFATPSFAATEVVHFPGCSKPMVFRFGTYWNDRFKDDNAKRHLSANPARQGDVADVFVLNTGNDYVFPMVIFSTLGSVKAMQGKISQTWFEALAEQIEASAVEMSDQDKNALMERVDRLIEGNAAQVEIGIKSIGFFAAERTGNSASIYSVVSSTVEDELVTYLGVAKYYYQDGCLGYATISLPAGTLGYRESIEALDSVILN